MIDILFRLQTSVNARSSPALGPEFPVRKAGRVALEVLLFQSVLITFTTQTERLFLQFESDRQLPANQARKSDVGAAEDRFKIIEKKLVCQVLNIAVKVERRSLPPQKVGSHREVGDCSGSNSASLKVDPTTFHRIV
jgi:hypothetical protein